MSKQTPPAKWDLILDWLEKAKKSRAELAADLGVTEGAISHWINGRYAPERDKLSEIRDITGFSIDELVDSLPRKAVAA